MRIDILSLFPAMFGGVFRESIIARAIKAGILDIHIVNPRDFATDKHRRMDDAPFGGGSGMVLKPEPFFAAVDFLRQTTAFAHRRTLLFSPKGEVFTQKKAKELSQYEQLILICGHYEGFDARIEENLPDEIISIGDYVLTGGELPAMILADAVARMLPGVLGSADSAVTDSFYEGILGYPQYTRPREFAGHTVPDVLFSGDHAKIRGWRREAALRETLLHRPDLLEKADLTKDDKKFLAALTKKVKN